MRLVWYIALGRGDAEKPRRLLCVSAALREALFTRPGHPGAFGIGGESGRDCGEARGRHPARPVLETGSGRVPPRGGGTGVEPGGEAGDAPEEVRPG